MKKTFIIISVLILLIVLIAFSSYMLIVYRTMQKNVDSYMTVTHLQVEENIASYLEEIESIGLSMCYSPSIQHYLLEDDPVKRIHLFSDVQSVFSNLYYMDHAITCFSMYDEEGYFLTANGASHSGITMQERIPLVTEPTYATEIPSNSHIGHTYGAYILTLPVLQQVNGATTKNYIGSIVLTVDSSFIRDQINLGSFSHGSLITLTDNGGKLLISSRTSADTHGMTVFKESTFDRVDWKLTTYHVDGVLTDEMQTIWQTTLLTAFLICCVLLLFVWMVLRQFLKPITEIQQFMETVSRNPGAQQYSNITASFDELRSMTESMNRMLGALEQKKEELLLQEKRTYEAELAKDQLEILAYRSQINPHFLYNTLECISGMAMMYNAKEITEISQSLSNMFRYAIKGNDFVTVEEELAHMREYATIIHYRFMGRISIQFIAEKESLAVMIPRLVLQPILENSVFHGLERKEGKGSIQVDVSTNGNMLLMRVSDDGMGMQETQLKEIQHRLDDINDLLVHNEHEKKGIGLKNIARRLYLFYPDEGKLSFESIPGCGTTVEIKLPIK